MFVDGIARQLILFKHGVSATDNILGRMVASYFSRRSYATAVRASQCRVWISCRL